MIADTRRNGLVLTLTIPETEILAHSLDGIPAQLPHALRARLDDEDLALLDELRRKIQGAHRLHRHQSAS